MTDRTEDFTETLTGDVGYNLRHFEFNGHHVLGAALCACNPEVIHHEPGATDLTTDPTLALLAEQRHTNELLALLLAEQRKGVSLNVDQANYLRDMGGLAQVVKAADSRARVVQR